MTARCWWGGEPNIRGETNTPVAAKSGVTAIAVGSAGWPCILALKDDGSVLAWGSNIDGESAVPTVAQSRVSAIAAGQCFTVALKQDGSVIAWRASSGGQTTVPTGLSGVTAIAAGAWHSVALVGSGWDLGAPLWLHAGGNAMILSWPTNATGFSPQSTQDLTLPANWLDVTNPPAVTGGQFTVTNHSSSPAQFFRLRKL